MPELPEVETVRRIVGPQIKGRTVTAVTECDGKIAGDPEEFGANIVGRTVLGTDRRGKHLLISLSGGERMDVHLGMTGCLLVTPRDMVPERHTRIVMDLSDGNQIRYVDMRRFGRFVCIPPGGDDCTGELGPEPVVGEITAEYLRNRIGNSNRPVKEALLDQSVVAGIGNIYSDEILHHAKINPGTRCSDLTEEEFASLSVSVPEIISWAIDKNALTPEEYLAGKGRDYRSSAGLRAYGRAGLPCTVCGTVMERTVIGGRSSCFCPVCQIKH